MPLSMGQTVTGRYRVAAYLTTGGMAALYRAWDLRLNVAVALKEMIPQPGLSAEQLRDLREQFSQEAQALARLRHPQLVRVLDFFEEAGHSYLVMEYIEGENLAERIAQKGALSEAQVLQWARQLLDALAHCHDQGLIHRDVKPQNVILNAADQAILVDFGLVKLWDPHDPHTRTVMRGMGTPEYAPPEQYDPGTEHTDARSDLYSVGATLYHALTGRAPPTATQRMANPASFQPPRALNKDISAALEQAVLRALALPRLERFGSAREMAAALEQAERRGAVPTSTPAAGDSAAGTAPLGSTGPSQPIVFVTPPAPPRWFDDPRRRRMGIVGGALLLAAIVLITLGALFLGGAFRPQPGKATVTATIATTTQISETLPLIQSPPIPTAQPTTRPGQPTSTLRPTVTLESTPRPGQPTSTLRPTATSRAPTLTPRPIRPTSTPTAAPTWPTSTPIPTPVPTEVQPTDRPTITPTPVTPTFTPPPPPFLLCDPSLSTGRMHW